VELRPDDQSGDLSDRFSDLLPIAAIALKSGNLGDEFADRPFDDGGEDPGDNENALLRLQRIDKAFFRFADWESILSGHSEQGFRNCRRIPETTIVKK
jgi:hypothetical protein